MARRDRVRSFLESRFAQRAVIAVIVVNAITIGCETSTHLMEHAGGLLHAVDRLALSIFVVELAARIYAYRRAFVKDPWNWFDSVIIVIALVPASGPASVLRALRILRALRLVSAVPSMRRVVGALLAAIPGMASIIGLLVLLMYVAAVISTELFRDVAPRFFADLPASLFTLFQIMTGDSWGSVAQEVMDQRPWAWVFFIAYILMSTFVVLNLFIAVVVNAMTEVDLDGRPHRAEHGVAAGPQDGAGGRDQAVPPAADRGNETELATVLAELARLHAKVDHLLATRDEPGTARDRSLQPAGNRTWPAGSDPLT